MRTTVTIDDQLLERVKERARAQGVTLGDLFEASLIRYLESPAPRPGPVLPVFRRGGQMLPGIDGSSNASMFEAADGPATIDGDLR